MAANIHTATDLAASITKDASQQTYYTIRYLVDPDLVTRAFQAYAYFRWLDDQLDETNLSQAARLTMIARQSMLIERTYRHEDVTGLSPEEEFIVDLIRSDAQPGGALQGYIRNLFAVMRFDATRRGRLITGQELADYTCWLATAVTEALHYFIGHGCLTPVSPTRYLPVTAAHITHMLRDIAEDVEAGYYNVPREFLDANHLSPYAIHSAPYRAWVKSRVELARGYFKAGRRYFANVPNFRCRLAGYAYSTSFERVLREIEQNDYLLQRTYSGLPQGFSFLGNLEPIQKAIFDYRRPTAVSTFPSGSASGHA